MAQTAIVYYSESNNTKAAAEYLAEKTGLSLIHLMGEKRTNPLQGMLHGSAALVGDPWKEIENFNQVILMSPIYAFNGVPAVREFLSKADLTGKELLLITNGAAPQGKISSKVHRQYSKMIEKTDGKVTLTLHTIGGNPSSFAGEEHIHGQVDKILSQVQTWMAG